MKASLIIVIMLALSPIIYGQAKNKPAITASKDEQALMELERVYADAVARQDTKVIDSLFDDSFVAISSRAEVRDKTAEINDIKPPTPTPDFVLEGFNLEDIKVRLFGSTAVVTGRSILKTNYKGRSSAITFRYTRVYVKRKKNWQVVAQQLTRIP
jgi:ketosteroid isomerase-like protein